jgi:site-specific DNA-methyltransferase (adenine-specific)
MAQWPDACIDAVVTDPPYELGFMGKTWDSTGIAYSAEMWGQVLRVIKPGGHLLAFGGTRTYHRMACAIEDAGFDIRDQLQWLYGSGFPKSLDVSKAIDKAAGHWRGRAGAVTIAVQNSKGTEYERTEKGEPITATATAWNGWGTALKPANEPIVLARKPLSEGTVAANVLRWGTGALNITSSRIGDEEITTIGTAKTGTAAFGDYAGMDPQDHIGRWPANILFDQYAAGMLDAQMSDASRFFYVAKPDGGERNGGLDDQEAATGGEATDRVEGSAVLRSPRAGAGRNGGNRNFHPTVKPVDLMAYLIKLVTPPGGGSLRPFHWFGDYGHRGGPPWVLVCRLRDEPRIHSDCRKADCARVGAGKISMTIKTKTHLNKFKAVSNLRAAEAALTDGMLL